MALGAILFIWNSGVPLFAQQQPVSAINTVVNELRQGDNQQALLIADQALTSQPGDCKLLSLKGVALTGLSRPEDALRSFKQALAKCPTYLPALEGAAQIEYAQRSAETVATLNRLVAVQPDNVIAQAMLASTLRAGDKCNEATAHYEAARTLFPSRPDLQLGYGSCLAHAGDFKAAIVQYLTLLSSQPSDTIRYDVALLQWKTNAAADAVATLEPLLLEARYEPALALGARIAEERADTPKAVQLLRTAIQLQPDDINNYLDFAKIAFNHKSFQVGIDMLDVGLQRSPGSAPLYLARGVLEVQLTKNDAAVRDFAEAHRIDPKLSFAVDAMGIMQSQEHQDSAALALFQTEARVHPDDPLLQYLLAEQLSQSAGERGEANLQAAIAAAERATKLDPLYQPAHDLLATLYVRASRPQLAIREAELALAQDPNDEAALFQELMARRRSGDTESIQSLTARLKTARTQNAQNQQVTDRYRLQEEAPR